MKNWKRVCWISCVLGLMLCSAACEGRLPAAAQTEGAPKVLREIAYGSGREDNRIYLKENQTWIPYLVLTDDYEGYCLLLREYLLDSAYIYNLGQDKPSYYEGSAIDLFLCNTFWETLDARVRDFIPACEIEITARDSLGTGGETTTTISRQVFLLSFTEVNAGASRTNLQEGTPLAYFSSQARRVAYYSSGAAGSWWLRTPNTAGRTVVCGVSREGVVGIGGIYDPNTNDGFYNGVRPAFCLPSDIPIEIIKIQGGEGYGIALPVDGVWKPE